MVWDERWKFGAQYSFHVIGYDLPLNCISVGFLGLPNRESRRDLRWHSPYRVGSTQVDRAFCSTAAGDVESMVIAWYLGNTGPEIVADAISDNGGGDEWLLRLLRGDPEWKDSIPRPAPPLYNPESLRRVRLMPDATRDVSRLVPLLDAIALRDDEIPPAMRYVSEPQTFNIRFVGPDGNPAPVGVGSIIQVGKLDRPLPGAMPIVRHTLQLIVNGNQRADVSELQLLADGVTLMGRVMRLHENRNPATEASP